MPERKQLIEGLLGAPANPLMNVGMSMLASRYDPSVNPWTASMESLMLAKKSADLEQDRQRQQQLRDRLAQFFGPAGGGTPPPPMGAMSPAPPMGGPMPAGGGMAGQIAPQMTQQQRFGGLPYQHQQYLRNMALRDLLDTGE